MFPREFNDVTPLPIYDIYLVNLRQKINQIQNVTFDIGL